VWVDSPWIEWKISLIVSTFSIVLGPGIRVARLEYGHGEADFLLEANLNNVPQRQKFSGAEKGGR
jgi:hypothetical protein